MKYLRKFNEGSFYLDKDCTQDESYMEDNFNVTLRDIKDAVQDALDESEYLSCSVLINDDEFLIMFHIIYEWYEDVDIGRFPRKWVTKHMDTIRHNLDYHGLEIRFISNEDDPDNDRVFAVNLFVEKKGLLKEGKIFMTRDHNASDLENDFNISMDEIRVLTQDILDEDIDCSIHWKICLAPAPQFILSFKQIDRENNRVSFTRELVTKHVPDLKENLKYYGLHIYDITSSKDPDDYMTYEISIFIKKIEHKFISENLNITDTSDEHNLERYFELTSNDVRDWFQDFLDEHLELGFEVSVINRKHFFINFFKLNDTGSIIHNSITEEKYSLTSELIDSIHNVLKTYNLELDVQDGVGRFVYYPASKNYMTVSISKTG